ncbi:MAG: flavodoxin family protein [Candidatus Geothermincolia bacterium]
MKVLVLTANPRKAGALATLTAEAARGAVDGGAQVEEVRLADRNIAYCKFCLKCHEDLGSAIAYCVQKDDMNELMDSIREADAYVMACPASGGHANAIMKTLIERTTWTLGSATRNVLWVKGCPGSRIADKQRRAVTITTAGVVPTWSRVLCNGSTREMSSHARGIFNAEIIGKLYAGSIFKRGVTARQRRKAYSLGRALTERSAV